MALIYPENWDFTPNPPGTLPSLAEVRDRIVALVEAAGTALPMRAVARTVVKYYEDQNVHHSRAMDIVLEQVRLIQNTWHPPAVEEE